MDSLFILDIVLNFLSARWVLEGVFTLVSARLSVCLCAYKRERDCEREGWGWVVHTELSVRNLENPLHLNPQPLKRGLGSMTQYAIL